MRREIKRIVKELKGIETFQKEMYLAQLRLNEFARNGKKGV